jgi:hypothetical protein
VAASRSIYELLKRKCALIIAVDAEADPDMTSASLVQLEHFARIDLGTHIVMDWKSIGARSLAVSQEVRRPPIMTLLKAGIGSAVAAMPVGKICRCLGIL